MTVLQKKTDNPIAHLTPEDIETLGVELDAIRQSIVDSRGADDAAYIRKVIDAQRKLELGSRAVLLASMFPPAWVVGTAGLSIAKIIENMEIGHNVMHGQWDWMRDPKIHSTTWEWDNASPSEQWKHSHNELHHTYTNVIGKDNDLGYGIMRVDEDQRWVPLYLAQPLWNFVNACFFEYGIAAYDLELGKNLKSEKRRSSPEFKARAKQTLKKIREQMTKDYVVHPLLSGPSALTTLTANMTANLVRNLWTHSVIMCGHFPEGVADLRAPVDRRRDPRRVVPAPDARLGQHHRRQGHALHDRQPVVPGRAPPVPRPAEQPLRGDRPAGAGAVREVRPALRHRLAAPPGRLGLEEGRSGSRCRTTSARRRRPQSSSSRVRPCVVPRTPPRPDRPLGTGPRHNRGHHSTRAAREQERHGHRRHRRGSRPRWTSPCRTGSARRNSTGRKTIGHASGPSAATAAPTGTATRSLAST